MGPAIAVYALEAIFTIATLNSPVQSHPRLNVIADSGVEFLLVFHSNYMSIYRRLHDSGDFHYGDLDLPPTPP